MTNLRAFHHELMTFHKNKKENVILKPSLDFTAYRVDSHLTLFNQTFFFS